MFSLLVQTFCKNSFSIMDVRKGFKYTFELNLLRNLVIPSLKKYIFDSITKGIACNALFNLIFIILVLLSIPS